ncbi:MAG: DUF4266 domain-containing protein [Deltaproteobacteria bacterium]|nr:DUF4266 domain-containing protein [Deltaproteobacteria bacterium]
MRKFWVWIALGIAAAVMASACVVVAPYDRELLADPAMSQDNEGLADLYEQKMLQTRESCLPKAGSASAGCGCK